MTTQSVGATHGCQGPSRMDPEGYSQPENVGETGLLPDPFDAMLNSGDPMERIAALLTRSFRKDRENAREAAAIEERNIMAEGKKRVEDLRNKADAIRKEGYTSGAVKIVSGAATIESNLQLAVPSNVQMDEELYSALLSGGDKILGGFGDGIADMYRAEQVDSESNAAEHEALSDAAKRRAEDYRDQAREARELLDKVASFLREVKDAQDGASKAAILRA